MTADKYNELFLLHSQYALRYVSNKYGMSKELAEDLAQDSYVRGYERRNQIRDVGSFKFWLTSLVLNLAKTQYRSEHVFKDCASLDSRYTGAINEHQEKLVRMLSLRGYNPNVADRRMEFEKVLEMIPYLPEKNRNVLEGYYFRGEQNFRGEDRARLHRAIVGLKAMYGFPLKEYERKSLGKTVESVKRYREARQNGLLRRQKPVKAAKRRDSGLPA